MARTVRTVSKTTLFDLTAAERSALEGLAQRPTAMGMRAKIVLASAGQGKAAKPVPVDTVLAELNASRESVNKWRKRFLTERLAGLSEELRAGGPRTMTDEQIAKVVGETLGKKPRLGTQWTARELAERTGVSQQTVAKVWRAFDLAPQRTEAVTLATDPLALDRAHDVVGLYLAPPERALVVCVDENRRSATGYAGNPDRGLAEVLELTDGQVVGSLHRRHRAVEFRKFLDNLENTVPAGLQVHLICDSYATHKAPTVKNWLLAHPRFQLHFTGTGPAWTELASRWLAALRSTDTALAQQVRDWVGTLGAETATDEEEEAETLASFAWTKDTAAIQQALGG
ncbi:helix-turn-helix domain-containing protein [Kitasatospora sp. P5_F3]